MLVAAIILLIIIIKLIKKRKRIEQRGHSRKWEIDLDENEGETKERVDEDVDVDDGEDNGLVTDNKDGNNNNEKVKTLAESEVENIKEESMGDKSVDGKSVREEGLKKKVESEIPLSEGGEFSTVTVSVFGKEIEMKKKINEKIVENDDIAEIKIGT
jgi:competence protein ComGC